jgi:hypothetical protein
MWPRVFPPDRGGVGTPTAHTGDRHVPAPAAHTRGTALLATAAVTAIALGTGAGPAAARPDAGPTAARIGHVGECFLTRVGAQYTRCDNNTGNGVPAPAWVPER